MKVIFLDIDGVLNTSNSYTVSSNLQLPIDNFRLNYLRYIVEKTDAKIVLSSSFRHFFQKENNVMVPKTLKGKKLYDLFYRFGITIYDVTQITKDKREYQIKEWLEQHNDVESFVILDDDPSLFYELKDRLIQTSIIRKNNLLMTMDDSTGLCEYHIPQIVDMLNDEYTMSIKCTKFSK